MIVVDASVWISHFYAADSHHAASRRWVGEWRSRGGIVMAPTLLIAEVGGAVARRTGQAGLAEQIVADLLADPTVELVELDHDLAEVAAREAVAFRLRGADATYVAVARTFRIPLVTWDREQADRTAGAVRVYTPETAPTVPSDPDEAPDGEERTPG